MTNLKNIMWEVGNEARGIISKDEIKNLLLLLNFTFYLCERIRATENNNGFICFGSPFLLDELSVNIHEHSFMNNLESIETNYDVQLLLDDTCDAMPELNAIIQDLEVYNILKKLPDHFYRKISVLLCEMNKQTKNYKKGFNEIVETFQGHDGKRGDYFTTPSSIKKLYSKLLPGVTSILDPACGNGDLLEAFSDRTYQRTGFDNHIKSVAVAKLRYAFDENIVVENEDSLKTPSNKMAMDAVIINPPFNLKLSSDGYTELDYLEYGLPPKSNSSLLWMQLALYHLNDTGRALVLTSSGSLSSLGSEGQVRKNLVEAGVVEAIITLPAGLFSYTNISSTLWILSKEARAVKDILMIDVTDKGIRSKDGTTDISDSVISNITDCYNHYLLNQNISSFSKYQASIVSLSELLETDFNLNPSRHLPVAGLENLELENTTILSSVLTLGKPIHRNNLNLTHVKRISVRNLSSSPDVFKLSLDELDEVEINSIKSNILFHKGERLLISRVGEKLKPSYLPELSNDDVVGISNIYAFKVDKDKVFVDYLIQELNKEYVQLQTSRFVKGTALPHISDKDFLKIKIPLPSLVEQKLQVKKEKEIRFQSLAKLHGYEKEIERLVSQQHKDIGSKKHNILQPLNNADLLLTCLISSLEEWNGNITLEDTKGGEVSIRDMITGIKHSINRSIQYAKNLTADVNFGKAESKDCVEFLRKYFNGKLKPKNVEIVEQIDKISFQTSEGLEETPPLVYISDIGLEQIVENIFQNALNHGFVDDTLSYIFKYQISLVIAKNQQYVEIKFLNNGKPFPKGMGTKDRYITQGEKAGATGNTGEGGARVFQVVSEFDGDLEVLDSPQDIFPVGIVVRFKLDA